MALKDTFHQLFQVEAHNHPGLRSVAFNGRSDQAILPDMAQALGISSNAFKAQQNEFLDAYYKNLHNVLRPRYRLGCRKGILTTGKPISAISPRKYG